MRNSVFELLMRAVCIYELIIKLLLNFNFNFNFNFRYD